MSLTALSRLAVAGAEPASTPTVGPDFLAGGGGEMGARMRALDWTRTPLGPPEHWPQSLKTIVRVMLDSRYAMWMLWGPELTFFCNDAYLPTVGLKRDWVLGARSDKVWEEIWPDIGPRIRQVLDTGQATWDEGLLLYLERSGFTEESYHTFSYSPIYDDASRIAGMLCVVTEVTQRVIAERQMRTLRDLAAQATGAGTVEQVCARLMAVLDADPLDLPFAALYLLDAAREKATLAASCGAGLPEALRPAQVVLDRDESPWPIAQATREPQLIDFPDRLGPQAAGGADRVRRAVALPVHRPGASGRSAVLIAGVSPRLALDANYRRYFDLVAAQFAAAIADAEAYEAERRRAEALAEIDRAKTAFFSNVSHEFRTPLTLMLGPVEEASADASIAAPVRAQLEIARRNAIRLSKLVNTLLDFSRIEAGRVQASYEPTDLAAITTDLASTFRSAIERAGLHFDVTCAALDEPAFVDREMWEKIVLNLLSNAFKYTLDGGIRVRLSRDEGSAVLEVADTGVGIPRDELPRVFERFHRVEGTAGRTQEGSGIGLALVMELVRLHGGAIEVHSETAGSDRGTRFAVRLPLGSAHLPGDRIGPPRHAVSTAVGARAFVEEALRWNVPADDAPTTSPLPLPEASAPGYDPRVAATAGARVLLADDNADMRAYVSGLLAPTYRVEAVSDGEMALAAARRDKPDLLLSDIMMPRLDGLGLLAALRRDEGLRDLPVILLSARAGEEARIEGLDSGADDYLVKPFSARELLARVGALLELTRMRREQEERLQLALSSIHDQFFLLDSEWRYTLVNPRVEEMTGRPAAELLGRSILELFPDVAGTRFQSEVEAVVRTREPRRFEFEYRPFGRWFENAVYPAADGVAVLAVDISERKRAEALREEQRALLELVATGRPLDDCLRALAAAVSRLQPKARGGVMLADAKRLDRWFFADIPLSFADSLRGVAVEAMPAGTCSTAMLRNEPVSCSDVANDQRWSPAWRERCLAHGIAAIRSTPICGAGSVPSGAFFVCFGEPGEPDPWDLQIAEFGARLAAIAIERDNTQAGLRQREEQLRDANRRKDEFLAMLAHELRNPLAPIGTASEILARMLAQDPRTSGIVEMIKRQATQLTRLVDDLLDVSRITQGRIQLLRRPLDLSEVIAHAIETVEPQLRAKQHRLSNTSTSYVPLYVSGDHARLVQCIGNVLVNAVKYTAPGGEIRVRTRAEGSEISIEIADNGAGIAPELLPSVFDLFVQSDRTLDRAQGGLGIGLSVVKRLVEMHGGTVAARSEGQGRGSTFEIRLPRLARPGAAASEVAPARAPSRRVMVVDDNRDAADALAELLGLEGHEVRAVYSAKAALERIGEIRPDVALLDLGLPEMDGCELAQKLRAMPQASGVRLVALTGYGQPEDRQRTRAAGFDDHLVKPADLAALARVLAAG